MKRIILTVMVLANLVATQGWAARNGEFATSMNVQQSTLPMNLRWDGIYKFSDRIELYPQYVMLNGQYVENDDADTFGFNANEPVAVRYLENGMVEISVLLADEERGVFPEKVYVTEEEFAEAGLKIDGRGGVEELAANYSIYEDTKAAGRTKPKARMHWNGKKGCVAYVSKKLNFTGRSGNGKGMADALLATGRWKTVSCQNPRPGTVASWTGGSHGLGHTAIWEAGRGWCYDLGCHDPGSKYRLKKCVAPK